MRIRFVGGHLNNRIIECGASPQPRYAVVVQRADVYREERYELNSFRTGRKTKYLQYIHESLLAKNGRPDACTYRERFKKWKPSISLRSQS